MIHDVDRELICEECGMKLQPDCLYCHYCGKKIRNRKRRVSFAKLAAIFTFALCIVITCAFSYYFILNYQNGVSAMNRNNFIAAQRYFDKIPYSDRLFPDECAYIRAGALMERGKLVEALDAFHKLNVPASDFITRSLKEKIYVQAQENYRSGSFANAKKEFTSIENYKRSNDYIFLMKCSVGSLDEYYDDLFALIGFEDADKIILENFNYLELFLKGKWRNINDSKYFIFEKNGSVSYNLPSYGWDNHFLKDGIYYVYNRNSSSWIEQFQFSIVSEDIISVYCFKDGSTHKLFRK